MPQRPARSVVITLEGGDGSGKSTQARALAERLRGAGYTVCLTGEPAGAGLGRTTKALLEWVGSRAEPRTLSPMAEMLLFEARRAQHVAEVIAPALDRGEVVLCDRFTDSTLAYQGYGRGLDHEAIRVCNRMATGGLEPDLTLLFDVRPETGLARADAPAPGETSRKRKDAIGQAPPEFHRRVREGFLALAAAEPARFAVIDASPPAAEVTERAWAAVRAVLPKAASRP